MHLAPPMTRTYRFSAFVAWAAMAALAVSGFAAFSPPWDNHSVPPGSGRTAGGVAALAFYTSSVATPASFPAATARWKSTIKTYFDHEDVNQALAVISCESSGNPRAINSSSNASGLFQHLPRFWAERSDRAGFADADILDPEANVAVAAWLVYHGGGWRHWYPSATCWATPAGLG